MTLQKTINNMENYLTHKVNISTITKVDKYSTKRKNTDQS